MKYPSKMLARRQILAGLGLSGVLLPFVPLLEREAEAQGKPGAKRIIFVYSNNGTVHEKWLPSVNSDGLVLSEILAPLAQHREQLLVVDGQRYAATIEKGEQDGHFGGMNCALTNTPAKVIDPNDPDRNSLATGISIDQYIASVIGKDNKFSSLITSVQQDGDATTGALSYAGAGQPILPEGSPFALYDRVFGDFDTPTAVDPARAARVLDQGSILDLVRADLNRASSRISAADRSKLQAHAESLRSLERSLSTGLGALATDSCLRPERPASLGNYEDGIWENSNIPAISRLQIEMLVMSLACDLTRVATLQYGRAGAQHRMNWLGPEFETDPDNGPNDSTSGIHGLAHDEENPESRAKLAKCHAWYGGEVAYLVKRLGEIPEGNGTMADTTLVVWMNEMGTGSSHSLTNTPWVVVGSGGGYFATNRLISVPDASHGPLLLSFAHAFGIMDESFGDPDFCSGPLAGATG